MISEDRTLDDLKVARCSARILLGLWLASWAMIGGAAIVIWRALA